MAAGTRTITIKFDGSTKGLITAAALAGRAINGIGNNTSGLKKAEAEADALSQKLKKTADDAKANGSLMGGALALGLSAAAPVVSAALVGGVALGFVGVAALVQKNNQSVKASFGDLKSQVVGEMQGASDQVVPYLVKAGHSLQQEFANLGPQLRTAFSFAGPDIKILTTGVDNLAGNAMPGLVNTMRNSKPVVQGISSVLGDLGTTTTTVLDSVSSHSKEFGTDLDQIGGLIKNIGSIVAGVLPGLASGFGTTVGTVNRLLTVLKPIAPVVGDITGEVLPAVGAFKLFGLATSPLNTLGSKVAGIASNVGGFTKSLTGSEAAGVRVTNTTAKLGSALGKVGNALPLVGAGFALASAGAEKLFGNSNQLANSLLTQTGTALQATQTQLAKNDGTALALKNTLGGFGSFLASTFVPTTSDVESGLTDVQKAQVGYNESVANFGPKSKQAAAAQRDLAAANAQDEQAQRKLNQALLTTNEQLSQQEDILLASTNANLGYQSSVLGVQSAQKTYADAVKASGRNSLDARQAFIGLQQAQATEATAAESAAIAAHSNASASDQAKFKTDAYTGSVLSMAAASNGHMTPALQSMVSHLSAAELQSYRSTGAIKGTHTEIVKLPNGKSIKINVDGTGQAVTNAHKVRDAIAGVKSKTVYLDTYINTIIKGPGASAIGSAPGLSGLLGLDAPHRAKGGPVLAGMPYVVGDGGGPEIFVPQQSGRIVGTGESADILGGSGGWSGDLVFPIDLGSGVQQVIRISNREIRAKVRAGAGAR
jgi:hypothetical protein